MASRKKLTKEAKTKSDFRKSQKWRDFRKKKFDEQGGVDYITLKKLSKGFHTHHALLNVDEYSNLENEGNFLALNKQTHDLLHWALRYIKTYHSMEVIDRFYAEAKREALLR